jgi:hypothetical protein
MRKFTALLGVAAMLTILPATPAFAQATVDKGDGTCEGQVFNSAGVFSGPVFTGNLVYRTTGSGAQILTCHFNVPPALQPARTVHTRGFECYVDEVVTTNTRASISRGGRMLLTCRL